MMISRRTVCMGVVALGGSGCRFYSDVPPVVIGGAEVSADKPIMAALRASSEHGRLVAALEESGLDAELTDLGPITFFAPTDDAFTLLRPKTAKAQIDADGGVLKQVLLGHMIEARLTTEDLLDAFPQLNGKTKVFSKNKQVIRMTGDPKAPRLVDLRKRSIKVLEHDAIASNGIIHVVDGLLLPTADTLASP